MTTEQQAISSIELTLRNHGPMFYGDDTTARRIAEEWHDYDFRPDQVDQWCKAYCWDPDIAAEFHNAGMTPKTAARACELFDAKYGGDSMYAACNEDLDAQSVISLYKAS
jgi:hypothetical protein